MAPRSTMPSLAALLGLLAVAGYQNRDKLGQVLQDARSGAGAGGSGGGILGGLGDLFGGQDGSFSKGLGELIDRFKNGGEHETADSWVNPGTPSKQLSPQQVEAAIGKEELEELAAKTGLDYQELLTRLSSSIPDAVDKMTPEGNLPRDDDEASRWLAGGASANPLPRA